MSALSSEQLPPNGEREDWTSEMVDVFPVYQVFPDNAEYYPVTSPIMPPLPGYFPMSPIPPGPDYLPRK